VLTVLLRKRILKHDYKVVPEKNNNKLLHETELHLFSIKMTDSATLSVTMLGAGQEVGRSCCVLQYRGKTIVCDTGVHPAYSGLASLPFIDDLDWSTVDAILITQ